VPTDAPRFAAGVRWYPSLLGNPTIEGEHMGSLKHPIALRTAYADDAESIATLHTDSWRRTYRGMMTDEFLDGEALANRQRVWRERLNASDPNQFVCVAQHASGIVGFICAFANQDPTWGSYIDNLHVSHGMHRSGLGTALMRSVAEWLCRVEPERGVYLWVMEANASAREFYDRLGAMNAGTVDKEDPGGGHAPNCRYVWAQPRVLLRSG
jgi:ribosomal protein S18 acetylase RimI-like enzyme